VKCLFLFENNSLTFSGGGNNSFTIFIVVVVDESRRDFVTGRLFCYQTIFFSSKLSKEKRYNNNYCYVFIIF